MDCEVIGWNPLADEVEPFQVLAATPRPPLPSDSSAHEEALCNRQQRSLMYAVRMAYADRITIEPGKRGRTPCIRGLRITVYDVEAADMRACLQFAADRERRLVSIPLE